MNPTLLHKIYKMHGIKKKKLRWYKTSKEQDPVKARQMLTTMKRLLTNARRDGYRVIYIDETMTTRKSVADTEWAR